MKQIETKNLFNYRSSQLSTWFANSLYPWELLSQTRKWIASHQTGIVCAIPDGVHLINREQIAIGEGCSIEPGACIEGPVYIGRGCVVSHGAYIRSGTILCDGAVVGHASEVKNSILLEGARAPHFNYVGDSILGLNVNLGAGVKCANVRLDREAIIDGLTKCGAFIGDGASIGCNSVTNPGCVIEPGAKLPPCTSVNRSIKGIKT